MKRHQIRGIADPPAYFAIRRFLGRRVLGECLKGDRCFKFIVELIINIPVEVPLPFEVDADLLRRQAVEFADEGIDLGLTENNLP